MSILLIENKKYSKRAIQTLETIAGKIVRVIGLHCSLSSTIHWNEVAAAIQSLFPLLKYTGLPAIPEQVTIKAAILSAMRGSNPGQKLSEYSLIMLCKFIDTMISYMMEVLEETNESVVKEAHVRHVVFSAPVFSDLVPFLTDPFI